MEKLQLKTSKRAPLKDFEKNQTNKSNKKNKKTPQPRRLGAACSLTMMTPSAAAAATAAAAASRGNGGGGGSSGGGGERAGGAPIREGAARLPPVGTLTALAALPDGLVEPAAR